MHTVKFRIPNGGGGMVQGMASAELKKELTAWQDRHGLDHIHSSTKQGWYWHVEFVDDRSLVLFLTTFKPQRDHWLSNMRVE